MHLPQMVRYTQVKVEFTTMLCVLVIQQHNTYLIVEELIEFLFCFILFKVEF